MSDTPDVKIGTDKAAARPAIALWQALVLVVLGVGLAVMVFNTRLPFYRHELSLGILVFVALVLAAHRGLPATLRNGAVIFGTVVAMVGAAELYFTLTHRLSDSAKTTKGYDGRFLNPHRTMGYVPPAGTQISGFRYFIEEPDKYVYDVTYTFDEKARRIVPGVEVSGPCVLFFGGSFTLGEGLNDSETLPHQFMLASGNTLQTVNYGHAGYGPNHMLRAIEDGALADSCESSIAGVIYTTIPGHYHRSAGLSDWGPTSPMYALTEDGTFAEFAGPRFRTLVDYNTFLLRRESSLVREVWDLIVRNRAIELYLAIVRTAAQRIDEQTGAPFIVLYWDAPDDGLDLQLEGLSKENYRLLLVSELIGVEAAATLRIPLDGHPTKEANERLALALYEKLAPLLTDPSVAEARP